MLLMLQMNIRSMTQGVLQEDLKNEDEKGNGGSPVRMGGYIQNVSSTKNVSYNHARAKDSVPAPGIAPPSVWFLPENPGATSQLHYHKLRHIAPVSRTL